MKLSFTDSRNQSYKIKKVIGKKNLTTKKFKMKMKVRNNPIKHFRIS
jgi:hypothetical protein